MAEHAKASASAASRWMKCPGSVRLSEEFDSQQTSDFAEEGTVAHKASEIKLHLVNADKTVTQADLDDVRNSQYWCGEMDEATDFYVDIIQKKIAEMNNPDLSVEQKLDLSEWVPEGFGTADCVIVGDDILEICDLKYGKGIKINANDNPQLKLYALGAARIFEDLYTFSKIRMTIIQPRLDHVSSSEINKSDLYQWGESEVAPVAKKAIDGCDEYSAGDWCRWCPCKDACRTRADYNLSLAKLEFRDANLLTDEEIGEVLEKAETLNKYVNDIKDYAFKKAKDGACIKGYKLVAGRANRKIKDELIAVDKLKKAGFEEALLYKRNLIGIGDLEKLVGKSKLPEILGDTLEKPEGKPVLVPLSDKREPINSIHEDFKEDI